MGCAFLVLHACRRGTAFEIETSRRDSPTLYGITRRAVASKGGEPRSRWHLLQQYRSMPAATIGHPTTTPTVRHTYIMEVCKTPDATTLTVHHTYIMTAMSPGSQAVTNSAVLTGESSKAGGNVLPARASDASIDGWRADGKPQRFSNMAKLCQGFHPEGAR